MLMTMVMMMMVMGACVVWCFMMVLFFFDSNASTRATHIRINNIDKRAERYIHDGGEGWNAENKE